MDWAEVFRGLVGMLALLVAGAQVAMRFMISNHLQTENGRSRIKERTLSRAMLILLAGVGLGNLTHLNAEVSPSTILIAIGVFYSAYSLVDIWRWGKEEHTINGDCHPTEGG